MEFMDLTSTMRSRPFKILKVLVLYVLCMTALFSVFSLDVYADGGLTCAKCGADIESLDCYDEDYPELSDYIHCPFCGQHHLKYFGLKSAVFDVFSTLFGGSLFDDSAASSGDTLDTVAVLKVDVSEGSKLHDFFDNIGRKYYNNMAIFGKLLAVIYVLVEIIAHTTKDDMNPEHYSKCLIKIFLAILIIDMGYDIFLAILSAAGDVFNAVSSAPVQVTQNQACIYEDLAGGGIIKTFEEIGILFKYMLPYILMLLVKLLIKILCWSRLVEIVIRLMFAPIGMSNIVTEGTRGSGFKYLKKLFSVALQGAAIIGIIRIYGLINQGLMDAGGVIIDFYIPIMLGLVVLTMIFKAKTIADDLVGVS